MSDNVISLRNREMAKNLREIADQLDGDAATKVAYAIFVDCGDGDCVMSGDGFRDNQATVRYFTSFMTQHGFAQ